MNTSRPLGLLLFVGALASSTLLAAPASKRTNPTLPSDRATPTAQASHECDRMIVRSPAKKAPQSVKCTPALCAKRPACETACAKKT